MIAKRIKKTSGRGTKNLLAYVLNVEGQGKGDPTTWKLAEYIVDADHSGEKVAYTRITNCVSSDLLGADSVGWAVKEILAVQAQNTRSKSDKAYHLVVSFPGGEKPTREQMIDIEDELAKAIGLEEHQRISAVHQNTDNWHLHVVINKVHPTTLRNVEPYYDHLRLQEACAGLEIKHNLTRDNHVQDPDRPLNGRPAEMEAHAQRISFARWVKERSPELVKAATEAAAWADVHREFQRFGIVIKPRGAGLIICHVNDSKVRVKASDVSPLLSFARMTEQLGDYTPPAMPQSQGDPRPDVRPDPLTAEAPSMDTGHEAEEHGPQLDGPLPEPPLDFYDAGPLNETPETEDLWARFVVERDAAREAIKQARAELRHAHLKYVTDLRQWYSQRYRNAKAATLNRGNRIATYQQLSDQRKADNLRRKIREQSDRKIVTARHPIPTWVSFLERETRAGNEHARATLDRMPSRARLSVETELGSVHRSSVVTEQASGNGTQEGARVR